ncbi:Fur family transcriptional regulator [Pelagibacterium luteolum]|uniref:Fur family transcriptional regulator, zinc uptake regulator n=1 Tax=Pelagibacterium luteolum TaxID=440168 RepID=A0A1G7VJC4_9HYPH|nr:Fur family transcriptional regulator [Pelagibacterium luteolum]SDG59668.1 Fur family transcriptional regulator, zinc uptake regulator [Pelagibacterium luteolum]
MSAHTDLTRNQSLVLDRLEKAETPMSAYAILDQLRDDGLRAPLQIYRALDKLLDMGLAHRLESINAFVACAHPHCHASGLIAFAICEKCGQVSEFSDEIVRDRLAGWADREGFVVNRTTMEIRGNCRACAA